MSWIWRNEYCKNSPSSRSRISGVISTVGSISISFGKCLLQLRAEGPLMLRRHLEDEMQSQSIYLDGCRKRVHLVHDFKALHNFDQLHPHIRTDDRSEERRVGKERRSRWSPYH